MCNTFSAGYWSWLFRWTSLQNKFIILISDKVQNLFTRYVHYEQESLTGLRRTGQKNKDEGTFLDFIGKQNTRWCKPKRAFGRIKWRFWCSIWKVLKIEVNNTSMRLNTAGINTLYDCKQKLTVWLLPVWYIWWVIMFIFYQVIVYNFWWQTRMSKIVILTAVPFHMSTFNFSARRP